MSSIFNENNSKSVDGASPHRRLSQMKNHISSKKQQGNKQFIGINENIQHGRISEFHKTVRLNKSRNKNAFNTMTKGILREDDLFLTNMENDLLRKSYQMNEMNQMNETLMTRTNKNTIKQINETINATNAMTTN